MDNLMSLHGTSVDVLDSLWPPSNDLKESSTKVNMTPVKSGVWINDDSRQNYHYEPNTTTMKSLGNPSVYHRSSVDPNIDVELQDFELWSNFSAAQTEMIVTKTGRRMFPGYRIKLSGLDPTAKYCLLMDVVNVDQHRYKFQNGEWRVAGRGEPPIPQRFYLHPHSPATGRDWMKEIISFHKVKLTNSCGNSSNGKFLIHSMHRYQPRIHVVRADDVTNIQYDAMSTFAFPQTVFVTVTAYQNHEVTKLKIENNPFARGFRNEGGKTKNAQLVQTYRPFTLATKRMMGHHVPATNFSKRFKDQSDQVPWQPIHQPVPYVTDVTTSQPSDINQMPLTEINNYHRHNPAVFQPYTGDQQPGDFPVFQQTFSPAVFTPSETVSHPGFSSPQVSGSFDQVTTTGPYFTPASQSLHTSTALHEPMYSLPGGSESYCPDPSKQSTLQLAESYLPEVTQSSPFQFVESFSPEVNQRSSPQVADSYSPGVTQSSFMPSVESYSPNMSPTSQEGAESHLNGFTSNSPEECADSQSPTYLQNFCESQAAAEMFADSRSSGVSTSSPPEEFTSSYQDYKPSCVDPFTNSFIPVPETFQYNDTQSHFTTSMTSWEHSTLRPLAENGSPPSDEGYSSTAVSNPEEDSNFSTEAGRHDNNINLLLPSSP